MFDSTTFRWTYMTWTFFGVMTTASVFLTLISFILGVICRLNFGKGLPHHCAWLILATRAPLLTSCTPVNTQQPIEDDFKPLVIGDPEKVAFPSNSEPTYSIVFGSEAPVTPPPQTFARSAAPRFAQPMRMVNPSALQQPPPAIVSAPSEPPYPHPRRSQNSSVDHSASFSQQPADNKRWVIE